MAHQAHNIPWQTLADNFKYIYQNPRHKYTTNLYPLNKAGQSKRLIHFTNAFAKSLEEFSLSERAKYPAQYEPPEPEDIVLSHTTVRTIKDTVQKYRQSNSDNWLTHECPDSKSKTTCHGPCSCPLSLNDRRMKVWLNYIGCDCCISGGGPIERHMETVELFKALLLHNQMDSLLWIASHPKSYLDQMWIVSCCWDHEGEGWVEMVRHTLMVYICLNVFYVKPETYNSSLRKAHLQSIVRQGQRVRPEEEVDYRQTLSYQTMLLRCTEGYRHDTETFPHREFFGVKRGMNFTVHQAKEFLGAVPAERLKEPKECINTYLPTRDDVSCVLNYLGQKALPLELSFAILEFAEYVPQRMLTVEGDPLNAENSEMLRRYLSFCWDLLVRSDMLAKACGKTIGWTSEITECICMLWGQSYPRLAEEDIAFREEHDIHAAQHFGHRNRYIFVPLLEKRGKK